MYRSSMYQNSHVPKTPYPEKASLISVNIVSLTGQLIYGILYLTMLYLLNLLTVLNLIWIITGKTKRLFSIFNLRSREKESEARLVVWYN